MRTWDMNETVEVEFDESGKHRFKLTCSWMEGLPRCLFIMLNPSIADLEVCDRTLDKCIKIAKNNGYGSISVVNLFSYRTSKPEKLLAVEERNHSANLETVKKSIDEAKLIIAAWGEQGVWFNGCYPVFKYIEETEKKLYCLDENRYGWPRHPLYMKVDTVLKEYTF